MPIKYSFAKCNRLILVSSGVHVPPSRCVWHYRRRQVEGSIPTAKATAELLRTLITRQRHPDAAALLSDVREWGIQLQAAKPLGRSLEHHCQLTLPPDLLLVTSLDKIQAEQRGITCRAGSGEHSAARPAHDQRGVSCGESPFLISARLHLPKGTLLQQCPSHQLHSIATVLKRHI